MVRQTQKPLRDGIFRSAHHIFEYGYAGRMATKYI